MSWREYHDATKHTVESLRRSSHTLDWVNMPHPFRHYEGAPVIDLPPEPEFPAPDGPAFLSRLLYYSAAISAAKVVPSTGYKYALRVNPSSGNLHPTEFHFSARGIRNWPDGLYHYRASSHMAEQRMRGTPPYSAPLTFLLTSIAWREAWKYRDRAYRYCLLDIGHAWQALAYSAAALGCTTQATAVFEGDDFRVAEDEWPMLLVSISGNAIPIEVSAAANPVWTPGTPNPLSDIAIPYPSIDAIHKASKPAAESSYPQQTGHGTIDLPPAAPALRTYPEIARTRRSALDFRADAEPMTLPQLAAILDEAAHPAIQLYLYVHRVAGLDRGVYRHWPQSRQLELIRAGDQRITAAGLSLGQDLAGNSCVTFSMAADLDCGYRSAFFEAGALGQRLYITAETQGFQGTGIGAFFDDRVHTYLELDTTQAQVIYHFAIGRAVHDPRLEA